MKTQDTPSNITSEPVPIEPTDQPQTSATPFDLIEINGPKGPEPTRFGDWERKGRCIDF